MWGKGACSIGQGPAALYCPIYVGLEVNNRVSSFEAAGVARWPITGLHENGNLCRHLVGGDRAICSIREPTQEFSPELNGKNLPSSSGDQFPFRVTPRVDIYDAENCVCGMLYGKYGGCTRHYNTNCQQVGKCIQITSNLKTLSSETMSKKEAKESP